MNNGMIWLIVGIGALMLLGGSRGTAVRPNWAKLGVTGTRPEYSAITNEIIASEQIGF